MQKTLICFYLVFGLTAAHALINSVPPKSDRFHLGWMGSFFHTSENFSSSGGGYDSLPKDGKFQELQNAFMLDWDLGARLRLKSMINATMVQTENSSYSKSGSYFDRIKLGGEAWFLDRSFPLITNLEFTIPIFKPDFDGADAAASEGVYAAQADIAIQPSWRSFRGHFQAGYLYLSDGRSGRIPWNAGASYGLSTGRIEGGIRGIQSVIDDSSSTTDRAKRSSLINNAQAGSLKYFSADPIYQELYVSSRWGMIPNLDFSTDLGYTINGAKYARGFTIGLGLHWLIDSPFSSAKASPTPAPSEEFKYNSDTYKDSLFEEADPSKAKKRPVKKRGKSLKQMMDETEKALE